MPSRAANNTPDSAQTGNATGCHYHHERFDLHGLAKLSFTDCHFINCRFDGLDLSEANFIRCHFYDTKTELACSFKHARLTEA